jgi:hypothetical protein
MRCFALAAVLTSTCLAGSLAVISNHAGFARSGSIAIPALKKDAVYGFLYSIDTVRPDTRITIDLSQGSETLAHKTLHVGDPDLYADFRAPGNGPANVRISAEGAPVHFRMEVQEWPAKAPVKAGPAHEWQHATPAALGGVMFASGDEAEYIRTPGTPRAATLEDWRGADWYRFTFTGSKPKLVFFQLELMERDNVPVDVSVYRIVDGKPKGFYDGEDPVSFPHEVQALQGNKFTARVLKETGDYYVCVRANHPAYKLRTRVYDAPPYADPHQAVRTAIDYILAAGDSWHANTPRRGGTLDRVEPVHQETSLCVACHTTHFPQRAQLYATRNGYPVVQRQQLQFLSERFYNNPRPFYGFEQEGATWARVISAPANVLSRMSYLMNMLEDYITGERRKEFHSGIAHYLQLYYRDRDKLPPDETNGNTPLVSAHEVAWYSWGVTKDARLPEMIAHGEVKNMVDLCYQTLALAEVDRAKYAEQIRANAERILSLQRPDGQWSMRFDPKQPEVEFQTGHALWALQAAGVPRDNPQVAKAIAYLLKRQQPFGGWMDPLQSFENFRTPFRETQMAAVALSAYFPVEEHHKGWDAPPLEKLDEDPGTLLTQLDAVWEKPAPEVLRGIAAATHSNNPLIRQAAVEALGRVADPATMDTLIPRLGDESKLVQRTAAWAVRQIYSRRSAPSAPLVAALSSANVRTQWGATRVFATHFSALARRPEFARSLIANLDAPTPTVRMLAARALWQFWFWSPEDRVKSTIEDALLAAMAKAQHPWVDVNLRRAVYNLADENVRYLYNNWVPLMGRQEDRERAINGRLAVEKRLADKFAAVLERGSDHQRKMLLAGLTEFPLRRADVYDIKADLTKNAPPVYNRIGNDIEQIVFFGNTADRLARSLKPLLSAKDPELRRLAEEGALLVREAKFPGVNALAGERHEKIETAAKVHAPTAVAAVARQRAKGKLDENFFRGYVQPILEKRGKDGYACVQCHATHTLFDATLATVRNVVDTDDPENSLILRKPTSSSEAEGIPGAQSHGGGVRWEKNSPEYLTILDWIKGAKE